MSTLTAARVPDSIPTGGCGTDASRSTRTWALSIGVLAMALIGHGASAATCDSVRTDLVGQNVYGQHTMIQLSQETSAGDCSAAAYLSRRAKDAEGFIATNCPADKDMMERAATLLKLGQSVLDTPACKN